jgi:lipopolysaccharide/colanic/teichoic acid biosynthesis glycosyltransferase
LSDPRHLAVPPAKRAFDLLALVLVAPFVLPACLVIAVAVFLDSRGPVIFRAPRIGMGGTAFEMLKFRTMQVGVAGHAISGSGDNRITPVGRFLRAARLDELPQLWNVLRGQMSLVGPRPELKEFVDMHGDDYEGILEVPPGLTGPTQLRYAGVEASLLGMHEDPELYYREHLLPDKVALDLEYARANSLRSDCRVLLQTLALPLILLLQRHSDEQERGARPYAYAGAVTAIVILPLLFTLGLGSPR